MDHETFAVVNQSKHNISSLHSNQEYDADAEAKKKIRSRPTFFLLCTRCEQRNDVYRAIPKSLSLRKETPKHRLNAIIRYSLFHFSCV